MKMIFAKLKEYIGDKKSIIRLVIHEFGNFLRCIKIKYLKLAGITIGRNTMISLGAKIDVRRGRISI